MTAPVLAHRVSGTADGDPVLLLNGGLMTFASWGPIAEDLERGFRVVAFDFRGMLRSPGVPPATLDGHADDVVRLIDHLGIARVHAVGTSFGAEVAVLLAAARPDRVRSLALVTATDHITPSMFDAGTRLREASLRAAAGGDGGVILDLLIESAFSPAYVAAHADTFADRRRQFGAMPSSGSNRSPHCSRPSSTWICGRRSRASRAPRSSSGRSWTGPFRRRIRRRSPPAYRAPGSRSCPAAATRWLPSSRSPCSPFSGRSSQPA